MMEQKKSKYDTNPLDRNVAREADDAWGATRLGTEGAQGSPETEEVSGATREIGRTPQAQARNDPGTEAPTRRYDYPNSNTSYPSVFVPPVYQPPAARAESEPSRPYNATAGFTSPPTSRSVRGINLPENVMMIAPYLPFPVVGAAVGAVELFIVPRDERRVRFHAAQGLALHLIVLAVSILTSTVDDLLSGPARVMLTVASGIFSLAAFVFLIVSMIRVWKGEPHVVGPVSELTRWLDEKIEPRK